MYVEGTRLEGQGVEEVGVFVEELRVHVEEVGTEPHRRGGLGPLYVEGCSTDSRS